MDTLNTFYTTTTAKVARAESFGLLVVCVVLTLTHLGDINWWVFVALFLVIDLVGYLPGMLAYRRSPDRSIPSIYYVLYDVMHCYVTWTVLLGAAVLAGGWEWAYLAVPVHLLGDRGLFGNAVKSTVVPFEPVRLPQFENFQEELDASPRPWRPIVEAPSEATEREEVGRHAVR